MTHRVEVAVAAAYLGEYQQIRQDTLPDAGSTRLMHRISTYATFVVRLGSRFSLAETVYAQPRIGLPEDVRLLEDVELLGTLSEHLSLSSPGRWPSTMFRPSRSSRSTPACACSSR